MDMASLCPTDSAMTGVEERKAKKKALKGEVRGSEQVAQALKQGQLRG